MIEQTQNSEGIPRPPDGGSSDHLSQHRIGQQGQQSVDDIIRKYRQQQEREKNSGSGSSNTSDENKP